MNTNSSFPATPQSAPAPQQAPAPAQGTPQQQVNTSPIGGFLEDDYEEPATGGGKYTRFEIGDTEIRVMTNSVQGWVNWGEDEEGNRRPVRVPKSQKEILEKSAGYDENPRFFWAFVVWNYKTQQFEMCEITQKVIREQILTNYKNPKWGDPKSYDMTITRKGEGKKTTYQVTPSPSAQNWKVSDSYAALANEPILVEKIFDGEDPFSLTDEEKERAILMINETAKTVLPF